MTYHHVWLTKCNGEECSNGHVEANIPSDPDGWATDGTQHLCPECQQKQGDSPIEMTEEDPA